MQRLATDDDIKVVGMCALPRTSLNKAKPRDHKLSPSKTCTLFVTLQRLTINDDDIEVVGVVQPPPPPPPPPEPSVAERLAAANDETGLNLCMPPPHWHPTDMMLRGKCTFVELPLPGSAPQVCVCICACARARVRVYCGCGGMHVLLATKETPLFAVPAKHARSLVPADVGVRYYGIVVFCCIFFALLFMLVCINRE